MEQVSEIRFRIAAPPRTVFAHLRDPRSYVGLSPLVVEARDVRRDDDGTVHYVAVERFRFFGVLRYDNAIRVTIRTREDDGSFWVGGDVDSPGNVQLVYGYTIEPDGDGSVVADRIEVTAPIGLRGFSIRRASEVQAARARILAERLEVPAR
ncbi:SRPBCC family protein [Protaetiibacter mangrovi]|uniref:SRPBCC family protein n=1 Tax=Protaetiibacter mangrovi TaxID=2970926 RepID=A0ABT1ZDR9_9MICO|nr:SRPBCC family protein [Protaetiibacter mangrovi]MCS0498854.1 SRPBCC family protein [Protaetiibacter mangrovi]TPX05114.1 SRPBCC family protein [Schumannella luteola]